MRVGNPVSQFDSVGNPFAKAQQEIFKNGRDLLEGSPVERAQNAWRNDRMSSSSASILSHIGVFPLTASNRVRYAYITQIFHRRFPISNVPIVNSLSTKSSYTTSEVSED